VCNGNPLILPHLPTLRSLRSHPSQYDICFVVRVWGGRDEAAGIEHNLRLLEAVNKSRCTKRLLAYLVAGDLAKQEDRLRKQGIPTTRTPLTLQELWKESASASVNVIRLGMHNCIPWRFMDLLAMGACIVLDQLPQTVWNPELLVGEHFLDLGAATTPDRPLAEDRVYLEIPDRIEQFIGDKGRVSQLRASASAYFDQHGCPMAIGHKLLGHVCRVCESNG
jgi:hypothetical protein